jgi:hypothetical protein
MLPLREAQGQKAASKAADSRQEELRAADATDSQRAGTERNRERMAGPSGGGGGRSADPGGDGDLAGTSSGGGDLAGTRPEVGRGGNQTGTGLVERPPDGNGGRRTPDEDRGSLLPEGEGGRGRSSRGRQHARRRRRPEIGNSGDRLDGERRRPVSGRAAAAG